MSSAHCFNKAVNQARVELAARRERLKSQHDKGSPGIQVCAGLADMLDGIILDLYQAALDSVTSSDAEREILEHNIALVPHGGYGRRDVAPYSDVDLMLLCTSASQPGVTNLARALTQNIYDVGLTLGFSTRTNNEAISLALQDPKIFTSLVESRFLHGSVRLFTDFYSRFKTRSRRKWKSILQLVAQARRDERATVGAAVHVLKPNVKRSPGSLRDLQYIRWLAFLVHGEQEPQKLYRRNILSKADYKIIRSGRDYLLQLRNEMHFHAGKAQDVLNPDVQMRLATLNGFEDQDDLLAVEQFMQHYFNCTSQVRYTAKHFYASSKPRGWRTRLAVPGFVRILHGKFRLGPNNIGAVPKYLDQIKTNLEDVLQLMELASHHNRRIDHATWTAIRNTMISSKEIELSQSVAQQFMALLSKPARLGDQLRRLHRMRVLEKCIPAFHHARCLLQFNEYHKYTVDEHSLQAVEFATAFAQETSTLGNTYASLKNKGLMHLTLLLHDLGKGFPGDHSEVGETLARETAKRFGLSQHDTEVLAWLVLKHLNLAHTAFRHDLQDENVIVRFAAEVGSVEKLKMLFILTCADLAAVGPNVLNQWKQDLITELFQKTKQQLTGKSTDKYAQDWITQQSEKLLTQLTSPVATSKRSAASSATNPSGKSSDPIPSNQACQSYIDMLPPALLVNEQLSATAEYLQTVMQIEDGQIETWARFHPQQNVVEYAIAAKADALVGCFHRITGVLSSQQNSILSVEIIELPNGHVLDRFFVTDLASNQEPQAHRLNDIQEKINYSIQEQKASKPSFPVVWSGTSAVTAAELNPLPTKVNLDNVTAEKYTIVTIFAYDRVGLLYKITKALYDLKCEIHLAKIGTYIDQVVDVFYVTDRENDKIDSKERLANIRDTLLAKIERINK
jgi:[protein-PII] uridylyltransferase